MTLFSGQTLFVSLPGAEAMRLDFPGSIAEPQQVLESVVSVELRLALELVRDEGVRRGLAVKCVTRPELFTHGLSEDWFRDHVVGESQHLCLSDGTTVKHLPGIPSHVFFYNLCFRENFASLERLARRAPELISGVRTQVNSCFVLGSGITRARPESFFLGRAAPLAHGHSVLMPFFLNRDSVEDSVNRIAHLGVMATESLADFTAMLYLPLTESAMADRAFARAVAEVILQASFQPSCLLVLRLPAVHKAGNALAQGIAAILPALRDSGIVLPRINPRNIVLAMQDLEEDHPFFERFAFRLLVHESFDFWRHTSGFYARAQEVMVFAGAGAASLGDFLPFDISGIYGEKAARRWPGMTISA